MIEGGLLLLLSIGAIIGITVAYFSSTTTFENEFKTLKYGTTYIEKFTSPNNWLPGDETEKTLQVKNSGDVDEAVRVKVEEQWKSKNNTILPLKQGDNVVADIHFINDDDWTKVEADGEVYYYYNYKLAPGETTSKLLDKVTFNPNTNLEDTCITTMQGDVTTRVCNSNGAGYDGATYTLIFTVETVQYNKYTSVWKTGDTITLLDEKPDPLTVQEFAESQTNVPNAEYNEKTKGKMFQFTHTVNGNSINESRYIGDNPNNYVYFNCDEPQDEVEYNYAASCEVWRILGVFDVERTIEDSENAGQNITITETRMKLVRGTDLATTRMWDNRNSEQYSSGNYGKNDWNGSLMQTFLTEDYYNGTGEATSNGLKASARERIEDAIFYLGGFPYSTYDIIYNAEKIYEMERGTEVYNNTRPTSWEGKVALMYPSDMYMTYAKTDGVGCYNRPMSSSVCGSTNLVKSWIYNTNKLEGNSSNQWTWFLSSYSNQSHYVFYANLDNLGGVNASKLGGVLPVVYLKSSIRIKEGTGELENPYVLE